MGIKFIFIHQGLDFNRSKSNRYGIRFAKIEDEGKIYSRQKQQACGGSLSSHQDLIYTTAIVQSNHHDLGVSQPPYPHSFLAKPTLFKINK